jgi:5-methylcytosine-specific restriction endonuclease McrA
MADNTHPAVKAFYRSKEWHRVRQIVLKRDNWRCVWCHLQHYRGRKPGPIIDHITPLRRDWSLRFALANLRTLCRGCDNKRHAEKGGGRKVVAVSLSGFPVGSKWE